MMEDKDEGGSDELVSAGVPPFQSLLMDFLDNRAPLLGKHHFQSVEGLCCSCYKHQGYSLLKGCAVTVISTNVTVC